MAAIAVNLLRTASKLEGIPCKAAITEDKPSRDREEAVAYAGGLTSY
jgi:hypothetical protein